MVVPWISSSAEKDRDPTDYEMVEVVSTRWDPINDDNWLVRNLETGEESRVWGFYLRPVHPLEALSLAAE